MSANLDLVRSIYAAWERGGSSLVEWAQPEIEFVIADGPTPGSWSGRAAMTDAWRDFLRAWEEFRPRLISTASSTANASWCSSSSAGAARRAGWRSGRSGQRGAALWHIRGGKATRVVLYLDRERAFADLGLAPEGE